MASAEGTYRLLVLGLGLAACHVAPATTAHPEPTATQELGAARDSLDPDPGPPIRFAADAGLSTQTVEMIQCGPREVEVLVTAAAGDGTRLEGLPNNLWLSLHGPVLESFEAMDAELRLAGGSVSIDVPVRKGELSTHRARTSGPPHLVELVRGSLDGLSATPLELSEVATVIIEVEFFDHTMACDPTTPFGDLKTAARPTGSPSS